MGHGERGGRMKGGFCIRAMSRGDGETITSPPDDARMTLMYLLDYSRI
jgi:hypothetical protein